MAEKSDIEQALEELALKIANGGQISVTDLEGIGSHIEIQCIREDLLPNGKTVFGKSIDRKGEIFRLAEGLWGVSAGRWLEMEQEWQKSGRAKSGSDEKKGKDSLDDVVSAEILVRLIATIKLVIDYNQLEGGEIVADEAVAALNLVISEAVSKGRNRILRFGDKTLYTILKDGGIMIGTTGGKYLPDPETSLPKLFLMLLTILSSAYV